MVHYFTSTAIRAAKYNVSSRVLSIQFTSGSEFYSYPGVPQQIFDGLLAAPSKGTYFDQYIRQYSIAR